MSDDRFDNRRYYNEDTFSIQSTAGAVPVRNKKGEVSMEKVKVSRYISGKRPEYASRGRDERSSSESDSSDEEDFTRQRHKSPKDEGRVLTEDFIHTILINSHRNDSDLSTVRKKFNFWNSRLKAEYLKNFPDH